MGFLVKIILVDEFSQIFLSFTLKIFGKKKRKTYQIHCNFKGNARQGRAVSCQLWYSFSQAWIEWIE